MGDVEGGARTTDLKSYARERIRGIFSAICMPETPDGAIDEAGLRRDIRHCIDVIGADGIYLHGFYGNFWLLTSEERRFAMEVAADEIQGTVPLICRCAHESLRETVALMQHAEEHGADVISLLGPAHGGGSPQMVHDHFAELAKESSLGFSVFNTAQNGYVIPVEVLADLAEIPNVAAFKNARPLQETVALRSLLGDQVVVIDPSEETFLVNLLEYGQQAIYTGTNCMYDTSAHRPMRDYVDAALAGDAALATRRRDGMQALRDLHHRWVSGPWRDTARCPVAVVKYWNEQSGMSGGPVRPPLPELDDQEKAAFRRELEEVRRGLLDPAPVD